MNFDREIMCIDRNGGENAFKYSTEIGFDEGMQKIVFRVVPFNLQFDDWFEFSITKIGTNVGKVTTMSHNNVMEYIAKGIPDRMIEEASEVLKLKIISSTNKEQYKSLQTEWRSISATKVWRRLENANRANYDVESDIFSFISKL